MFLDFLLLISIGPIIAFFIYYLSDDRRRSQEYFEQDRGWNLEL
jgi:hypothetical protein